jgi:hypothetical protein
MVTSFLCVPTIIAEDGRHQNCGIAVTGAETFVEQLRHVVPVDRIEPIDSAGSGPFAAGGFTVSVRVMARQMSGTEGPRPEVCARARGAATA